MARVRLDGITKRYADVIAVEEMTLDIPDGEFVTFVGPSGCGKSTTMEIIAGLTTPSEGTVYIGDRDVTKLPPKDRNVSMVFQNIALFPHMNVYDNISFGLRLRKQSKDVIDEKVHRAAETVQIEEMLDRMPDAMSGGQRQRVAIARAIVRDPDVFLMDEPLANLDAKLRVHMRTEIQRLHKQLETTIIYVTHDQAEAMTMSDRIAVMNDGRLQQIAPPIECYNEPANRFVAGFIGSPSMNFVEATISGDRLVGEEFSVPMDDGTVPLEGAADRVTMGIRPEDLYPLENRDRVDAPSDTIHAYTDVIEPMGDETFVYLLVGESETPGMLADQDDVLQLLMSVEPDTTIGVDEEIDIVLDRSKVHVFDGQTDETIAHGVAVGETPPPHG